MSQKKPKPSKERLARLKAMKRKPSSSTPESNPVLLPAPKQHRIIPFPEQFHWNQTNTDIVTNKRGKRVTVKICNKDLDNYEKKRSPTFTLCEMVVQYNHLNGDGNLGKQVGVNDDGTPKVITNPKSARYSVTLAQGCPDKCEKLSQYKGLATLQENCMKWVKVQAEEMMRHAFNDKEVWPELKEKLGSMEEDEFVKNALYSFDKTDHGEDDEEVPLLKLTRKLTDWDGNKDPPRFWKINKKGTFEIFHPKFIKRGTFVIPSGQLRAYGFVKENGECVYGVSLDLGKEMIVVCFPEDEEERTGASQAMSDVPCLF